MDSGDPPARAHGAHIPARAVEEARRHRTGGRAPDASSSPGTGATPWARTHVSLCFEVTTAQVAESWAPGPLPVRLPDGRLADRRARATYFQPRAAASLYGPSHGSPACRWHRTDVDWHGTGGSLRGMELLSFPHYATESQAAPGGAGYANKASRYLAVFHLSLPAEDPISDLEAAVRLAPDNQSGLGRRELYTALLGPGFQIPDKVRRALSVTMLTYQDTPSPPRGAPEQWTATTGWLWCAASASRLQTFCPDVEDPHLLDGLVYLSSSWRALVLRDGISFVGLANDDKRDENSFFAWGESYVRSLYTDVALLAALQRDALDDFADRLAKIGNRFEKSAEFRRLVNEVTEFRNVFWWDHVTLHGAANHILGQLQAAHRTPGLFASVVADLDAFRQQVEAQALEVSVRIQEVEEKRARTFEHAASIAVISFALPALVFAGLAVPTSEGHDISGWLVLAVGLCALILGALAGAVGDRLISRRRL